MRTVFVFLLLFSSVAEARRSLSPDAFQARVRPVLNGILNDFYQMIVLFPEYPKDIVSIVERMDSLNVEKDALKQLCPRVIEEKCLPGVDSLRSKLASLQKRTLELLSNTRPAKSLHFNALTGQRMVKDFQVKLATIKGTLDNSSFLIRASIPDKKKTYDIIKDLDELKTMLSLAVVEFIPHPYKEDFRHFYFGFVHPIELQISKHKNYEFLNRNVNSLNFAINLLNMNLTKRNKKTPDGMVPYLSLIHNRWNSLLRYYM